MTDKTQNPWTVEHYDDFLEQDNGKGKWIVRFRGNMYGLISEGSFHDLAEKHTATMIEIMLNDAHKMALKEK